MLALFAATCFFGRQIAAIIGDENRFFMYWEHEHGIVLVLIIMALALLAVGIDAALSTSRRLRGLRQCYRYLYLIALVTPIVPYAIPYIPKIRHSPYNSELTWALLVAGVALFAWRRRDRALQTARSVALTFSALVPILFYQLLTASTYRIAPEHPHWDRPASARSRPIFLVLLDEWSYARSTENGQFLPSLVHVRELADQAFVFREAQSEAPYTKRSLPKILYQTDLPMVLRGGKTYFADGPALTPTATSPNLFTRAREHGYNTALIGFYLPYRFLLGDSVDYCQSISLFPVERGPLAMVWWNVENNWRFAQDPISFRLKARAIESRGWRFVEMEQFVHSQALQLIQECPRNTFAFIHEVGARPPFTYSAEAVRRGELDDDPQDYRQQVAHLDERLGEILTGLRAAGKFDDALIIVMADHAWRDDPDPNTRQMPGWVYHVPLLIKWPGQKTSHVIDRPFSLIQLHSLIDLASEGGSEQAALQTLRTLPLPTPKNEPMADRIVIPHLTDPLPKQ